MCKSETFWAGLCVRFLFFRINGAHAGSAALRCAAVRIRESPLNRRGLSRRVVLLYVFRE